MLYALEYCFFQKCKGGCLVCDVKENALINIYFELKTNILNAIKETFRKYYQSPV